MRSLVTGVTVGHCSLLCCHKAAVADGVREDEEAGQADREVGDSVAGQWHFLESVVEDEANVPDDQHGKNQEKPKRRRNGNDHPHFVSRIAKCPMRTGQRQRQGGLVEAERVDVL